MLVIVLSNLMLFFTKKSFYPQEFSTERKKHANPKIHIYF